MLYNLALKYLNFEKIEVKVICSIFAAIIPKIFKLSRIQLYAIIFQAFLGFF
jgi:hypothetical protein